jgi:hypothetical protein
MPAVAEMLKASEAAVVSGVSLRDINIALSMSTSCQTPSFRSTMAATSWRGPVHSSPSILRARAA